MLVLFGLGEMAWVLFLSFFVVRDEGPSAELLLSVGANLAFGAILLGLGIWRLRS
jgi:hypothetical protein